MDKPRCVAVVYPPGTLGPLYSYQCTRKAVTFLGHNGYCWQHDPERKERERQERVALEDREWAQIQQRSLQITRKALTLGVGRPSSVNGNLGTVTFTEAQLDAMLEKGHANG